MRTLHAICGPGHLPDLFPNMVKYEPDTGAPPEGGGGGTPPADGGDPAPPDAGLLNFQVPDPNAAPPSGDGTPPANIPPGTPPPENWQNSMPTQFQNHPALAKYKSHEDFLAGHVNLLSLASRKALVRPDMEASPETWDHYYKTLGRPESADKYSWEPTDREAFDFNPETFKGARDVLWKLGLTSDQFNGVMGIYEDDRMAEVTEQIDTEKNAANTTIMALHKDWGKDTEPNIREAHQFISKFGLGAHVLEKGLHQDAASMKMFFELSKLVGEHDPEIDNGMEALGSGDYESQLARIKSHPGWSNPRHPEYQKLQDQRNSLIKRRYGQKK